MSRERETAREGERERGSERERERQRIMFCQYRFIFSALIHRQLNSWRRFSLPRSFRHAHILAPQPAALHASVLAPAGGRLAPRAAVG